LVRKLPDHLELRITKNRDVLTFPRSHHWEMSYQPQLRIALLRAKSESGLFSVHDIHYPFEPHKRPRHGYYHMYPYFTDEETEVQRRQVNKNQQNS
jgi:hypothetical protein